MYIKFYHGTTFQAQQTWNSMILPLKDQEGMPKNHNQMTIKNLLQTQRWYQDLLYKLSKMEKFNELHLLLIGIFKLITFTFHVKLLKPKYMPITKIQCFCCVNYSKDHEGQLTKVEWNHYIESLWA